MEEVLESFTEVVEAWFTIGSSDETVLGALAVASEPHVTVETILRQLVVLVLPKIVLLLPGNQRIHWCFVNVADEKIRTFQADAARDAGIFHHLITLPTYHTAALSTDNLAKEYFGAAGMLGYVAGVQRKEIRQAIACVKHQNMSGSDIGDDHKEYFSGDAALKASGKDNTMNQFS